MPDFAYCYFVYFRQDNENIAKLECPVLFVSFPSRLTPKGSRNLKKVIKPTFLCISFPSTFFF